jgi:hypothetical protein
MPHSSSFDGPLTVSKVEAGRATLLTDNFEVLEVPASFLASGTTGQMVHLQITPANDAQLSRAKEHVRHTDNLQSLYSIPEDCVPKWREAIASTDFLSWGSIGRTAAVVTWKRSWSELSQGQRVLFYGVEAIAYSATYSSTGNDKKQTVRVPSRHRLHRLGASVSTLKNGFMSHDAVGAGLTALQLDLGALGAGDALALVFRTSAGCFGTLPIVFPGLPDKGSAALSGVHLLTLPNANEELKTLAGRAQAKGAEVRLVNECDCLELLPITAVIASSTDDLDTAEFARSNGLPVVSVDWLAELVRGANNEDGAGLASLPPFDFPFKSK